MCVWGGGGRGGGNCANNLSVEACLKFFIVQRNVQCVHVLCERG